MSARVRILHLEDDDLDAQLVAHQLRGVPGGVEIVRAHDEADFVAGLERRDLDIILSDKDLPDYDGLAAATFARAHRPDLPFVFVSGTLGEERVVEMMRAGATDYVFKDKLGKLPLAVERVLREGLDRRQLEESRTALSENEERFRQLAGAIHDVFYLATLDFSEVLYVSPGYEVLWQRSCASLLADARSWLEAVHPAADRERVGERLLSCRDGKCEIEYRILRPDGSIRWISDRTTLVLDEAGQPCRHAGIATDITARKQADLRIATEHAVVRCLSASRSLEGAAPELARVIVEGLDWAFGAVWIVDAKLGSLRCVATATGSGVDPAAFVSFARHVTVAQGVGLVGRAWSTAAPVRGGGVSSEAPPPATHAGQTSRAAIAFPVQAGDEVIGVIEIHSNNLEEADDRALVQTLLSIGTHIGGFVRARDREALLHLRQRVIQSFKHGLMVRELVRPGSPVIDVNPAFERATGYSAADVANLAPGFLAGPETDPDTLARSLEASREGSSFRGEMLMYRKDGSTFWGEQSVDPVHDSDGQLTHSAIVVIDVSERRALEEQFRQSQKLEAVGHLAGGVAHDFNNLLSVILGYTELALQELPGESDLRSSMEAVRRAGNRGASVTRQLLLFSRKQLLCPLVVDVNTLITNVQKMLRLMIGEDVLLTTHLDPDLWRVRADPAQIEQVLMNLVINARDAMPGGGRLIIESKNVRLDPARCKPSDEAHGRPYAMFSVSDSGTGMTPEILAKIYEPFFTTKPIGKGTGLGLATAFGIVKQSDGHIGVYSEVGVGTCFRVYLPQVDADLDAPRPVQEAAGNYEGTETVLVAEDEEFLRDLVVRLLTVKGYTVIQAASGSDALNVARQFDGPIHLLITDVVMPEISGPEAASRLLAVRPDLRVLYMSGYTARAVMADHNLDPSTNYIDKPFNPGALLAKVRQTLDKP